MSARVDMNWKYRGLQVLRMENEFLRIDVLPELGAKVFNFIYKPLDRNLLWHNPYIHPSCQSFGTCFDDVWPGGWDELIPNDLPFQLPSGEILADHGEVWSQESEWEVLEKGTSSVSARFVNYGRVIPLIFEKTITLRAEESMCRVSYHVTNNGNKPVKFLWNIHPSMVITPQTRIDVPAKRCITETWGTENFKDRTEFRWPNIELPDGEKLDISSVPPAEKGIAVFPYIWLFRSVGGWRGLYTLILATSTGYPNDLSEAVKFSGDNRESNTL